MSVCVDSSEQQPAHSFATLTRLSHNVHSNSESEANEALTTLAKLASNDAARALIEAYRDCHWRDTRIKILRALGRNASQRALEFLLRTARELFPEEQNDGTDTGLCQETLFALGDTRHPLAARFLLSRLERSPTYLKVWIVDALSRVPDLSATDNLYELFNSKECDEHPQLLRHVIIALSELKDTSILGKIVELLKQRTTHHGSATDETTLTLLSAMTRLTRHKEALTPFERAFEGDMLHRQYYQQCVAQVQVRQQWSLEDYLNKIFFCQTFHPALPFEMNSFPIEDVIEALSLFTTDEKHFSRLCKTLGCIRNVDGFLAQFLNAENLKSEQALCALEALALQRGPALKKLCADVARIHLPDLWKSSESQPLIARWLQTYLCNEERPLESIFELLTSNIYESAHDKQRIEVINAFTQCCLIYRTEKTWPKRHLQVIIDTIQRETSDHVLGRWIRALGDAGLSDLKWNEDMRKRMTRVTALRGSVLMMLESEHVQQNSTLLKALSPTVDEYPEHLSLFLRACSTLKNPEKDLPTDDQLTRSLASTRVYEQLAALKYLSRHPRTPCLNAVMTLCSPEQNDIRVTVAAIVAARAYRQEKTIDVLSLCLDSHSKVISGRALDALLYLEHPRSNECVIQYLLRHLNNSIVCDKILRSLKTSDSGQSDLSEQLENAVTHIGDSSLKEDLLELSARLKLGRADTSILEPAADAIREIDKQLESKITDYLKLPESVKASLRSAELPLYQPDIYEKTVDKSSSVVQYCKALDLTLEKDFGQKILFPKMEQQLHIFQNVIHQAELNNESPNINLVLRHFHAEHVFDFNTFPASKMSMISRSILTGRILRERAQVIDGLKAWAVLILMFSGHERLWGAALAKKDPLAFPLLAHKLVTLQDLRNPAAHRQTMLALAPLSEIRKEVFQVFSLMKKAFE